MKITRKKLIRLLKEALEDSIKPVVYQDDKLRTRRQRQELGIPGLLDKLDKLDQPRKDPVTGEMIDPDPEYVETARQLAIAMGSKEYDKGYINIPSEEMGELNIMKNAYTAIKKAGLKTDSSKKGMKSVIGSYFTDNFELVVRVKAVHGYYQAYGLSDVDPQATAWNTKNTIVYSYGIYFVDDRFNDDRTRLDLMIHGKSGRNPVNKDQSVLGSNYENVTLEAFSKKLKIFKFIVDNLIPIAVSRNYNPENALALAMNFIALNGEKIKDENMSNEEIARKVLSEAFVHEYIDIAESIERILSSSKRVNSLVLAKESEDYKSIFEKSVQDLASRIASGFESDPNFALKETIVNRLIKEFKVNKDFASIFDLDGLQAGGGDTLPPIEPPDGGGNGGGGGQGSEYPLRVVEMFAKSQEFNSFPMGNDYVSVDFRHSSMAVSGETQIGLVDCHFSFFDHSVGYTNIVDIISLNCKSNKDAQRIYSELRKMFLVISRINESNLNRELAKLGSRFFERYLPEEFLKAYKYTPPDPS